MTITPQDSISVEMAEILKQKTPRERLEIANGMWRSARTMLTRLVRAEHPDWPDDQVRLAVIARMADGTD